MEYLNMRLCSGYSNNPKPCEHFESCDMKIGFQWDENGNERYIIGRGCNSMKCKRDNPNYKPLTKAQFIEMYKQMPNRTNISLYELLECARINGMVDWEDHSMGKIKCEYEQRCRTRKTEPDKCASCGHNVLRNYVVDYYIKANDGEIPDKCPKLSYDGPAEQTAGYKCPVCGGFTNPYEIDRDLPLCKWCGYLLNI